MTRPRPLVPRDDPADSVRVVGEFGVIARVLDPRRAAWYAEQGLQTICPTQIAIEQLEQAALADT